MSSSNATVCPQCRRNVKPEHFACRSGAKGGRVGGKATGDSKRRGDSAHYRALAALRKDRKANNPISPTHVMRCDCADCQKIAELVREREAPVRLPERKDQDGKVPS